MGVRLLARTTRNVVATEAGERLMETLRPAFNDTRSRIEELERHAPKTRRVGPYYIQPASRGNDHHARRQTADGGLSGGQDRNLNRPKVRGSGCRAQ
ncbi:hypothetical protein [Ensifer canadensis]